MYNLTSGWWTWLNGGNYDTHPGEYGTKGVAAQGNMPPSRSYHAMAFDDLTRSIFVFSGQTAIMTFSNDLWMYNLTSGWWTWLSGSSTTSDYAGVFGQKGVAAPENVPGARLYTSMETDSDGRYIMMYGGMGCAGGMCADLWMYSLVSGWWTWLSGAGTNSAYGIKGVASPTNFPILRYYHTMSLDSRIKAVFVFGGDQNGDNPGGMIKLSPLKPVYSRVCNRRNE